MSLFMSGDVHLEKKENKSEPFIFGADCKLSEEAYQYLIAGAVLSPLYLDPPPPPPSHTQTHRHTHTLCLADVMVHYHETG